MQSWVSFNTYMVIKVLTLIELCLSCIIYVYIYWHIFLLPDTLCLELLFMTSQKRFMRISNLEALASHPVAAISNWRTTSIASRSPLTGTLALTELHSFRLEQLTLPTWLPLPSGMSLPGNSIGQFVCMLRTYSKKHPFFVLSKICDIVFVVNFKN